MDWKQGDFTVSDDKSRLDVKRVHAFLSQTYWANGRSLETVQASIEASLCFGLYLGDNQIGFARVVSDYCIAAVLHDVVVDPEFRNRRLGHFLIECVFNHPKLKSVKWALKTKHSHSLYKDFGFEEAVTGWMDRGPFQ